MKAKVYAESGKLVRNFGAEFTLEVDSHPRDQIAASQCIIGKLPDGKEITIPVHAIAVVVVT